MLKRYIKKLEKQQEEEEENNNSSSDQKNKNENEISLMLQSIQLSSSSSITTRDMMGRSSTNNDFLNQISNEIHFVLCEHYLFQSNSDESTSNIIIEENRRRWKMISLSDLFCILNVWRGTDLLSPLDVKQSIQILCSSSSSSQVSKSYTIPSSNNKVQVGYEIRYFSSCTTLLIFQKTFSDDNQEKENENERKLKEEEGEDGLQFGSGISKRGNDHQSHQGGGIDEIIKHQILNFVLSSYFSEPKKKKKGVSLEEIASYLKVSPLICQELVSWVEENHQYQFEFEEEEEMGDLIEEDEEELTIWLKNKALKKGNIVRDEDEWGTILYFPNLYF